MIYNAKIDIWAFGCTFYEVVHIKPMFHGSMFQLVSRISNVKLNKFEAECPEDFQKAIMQCFETDPADRPDALDLLENIETVRFHMKRKSSNKRFVENFL